MLDSRDIRTHRFAAQTRQGYKPEEVNDYLAQVAREYEENRREYDQLNAYAEQMAEKLKQFAAERDSISRALSKAEVMAENIVRDAHGEARGLIAAADDEAKQTLREARLKADDTVREATAIAQERLKKAAETADKVEAAARERSERLERSAEQKAHAALHNLKDQRDAIRREADELSALSAHFKLEMINTYEHQLRVLRQMPDEIVPGSEQLVMPEPAAPEEAPAPPPGDEPEAPEAGAGPVPVADTSGRFSGYFAEE